MAGAGQPPTASLHVGPQAAGGLPAPAMTQVEHRHRGLIHSLLGRRRHSFGRSAASAATRAAAWS